MSQTQLAPAPCPNCGNKELMLRTKGMFASLVMLECKCGTSGPWTSCQPFQTSWDVAADGWSRVAGADDRIPSNVGAAESRTS